MTVKTNYFDGISVVAADDIAPWAALLTDGVYGAVTGELNVLAHSPANLSVDVQEGQASKNGYFINSDSIVNVAISANTSGFNRIDSIVANIDTTNKETTIIALQGIPSSSPVAPAVASNQLLLATVLVGNNVSVLNQNVIMDARVNVDMLGGQLALRPIKTVQDITYYVDAVNGSDLNLGLSSGIGAFKSIGKAISMIPQIINHTITINIAAGTYPELILMNGYTGYGLIVIQGASNTNTLINNLFASACTCYMSIHDIQATSTVANGFGFSCCLKVTVMSCSCITDGKANQVNGLVATYGSNVYVNNCVFSNRRVAIDSNNASIGSYLNSGTGNDYVLDAENAGKIGKSGSQPTGTYAEITSGGGKIIVNNTTPSLGTTGYRYNDDGTIEQWGTASISTVTANTISGKVVTFPIAFPTACVSYKAGYQYTSSNDFTTSYCYPVSATQGSSGLKNGATAQAFTVFWRALGY